jgi:hypothetical protein
MRLRRVKLKNTSRILAKGLTAGNGFVLGADSNGEATWIQNSTAPYPYGEVFTYSEAISAASSGLLLTGSYYLITNTYAYTAKVHDQYIDSILVKALSATEFSNECYIKFFNCDWNGVGNYSSSPIGGASLDPVHPYYESYLDGTYTPGDVVIYRTQEYTPYEMYVKNNTASGTTAPSTNVGFTKLEPDIRKGWIHEVCSCEWDWNLHRLESRRDSNGNFYSLKITGNQLISDKFTSVTSFGWNMSTYNPVQAFPWGSNKHKNNIIIDSVFSSYIFESNYNKLNGSAVICISFGNEVYSGTNTYRFNKNSLDFSVIDNLNLFGASNSFDVNINISENYFNANSFLGNIDSITYDSNSTFSFSKNQIVSSSLDFLGYSVFKDHFIESNSFINTSISNSISLEGILIIRNNEFNNCLFDYTSFGWIEIERNSFENCEFVNCTLGEDPATIGAAVSTIKENKAKSFLFESIELFSGSMNKNEFKGNYSPGLSKFYAVVIRSGDSIDSNTFHADTQLDTIELNGTSISDNHFLFGSGLKNCTFAASNTIQRNYFTWLIDGLDFSSSIQIYRSRAIKHFVKGKSEDGDIWIVENDGGPTILTYITTD